MRKKQEDFERKAWSVERLKDDNRKNLLSRHGFMYGFSEQPVFLKAHKQTYHWKLSDEDVKETMEQAQKRHQDKLE